MYVGRKEWHYHIGYHSVQSNQYSYKSNIDSDIEYYFTVEQKLLYQIEIVEIEKYCKYSDSYDVIIKWFAVEYSFSGHKIRRDYQNDSPDEYMRKYFYKIFHVYYSYLRASIGSRSEAFLAGYHPKNIPVAVHTIKDKTIV